MRLGCAFQKLRDLSGDVLSAWIFSELGFPSDDSQNDCVHLGLLLVESDSGFHAKETDQNNIKKIGEKKEIGKGTCLEFCRWLGIIFNSVNFVSVVQTEGREKL